MTRTLITGSLGQIGTELYEALKNKNGDMNVIASDIRKPKDFDGRFEELDVTDADKLKSIVKKHDISVIYHLASLLSATGEQKPCVAWKVNTEGLKNVLDAAKDGIKVFWPSSIAVFGPTTPKDNTPQRTIIEPTTIYGVTKLAGEMLCQYYHLRFGVDVRSLRYPGLISYKAEPGGGTTDYAVDIFYKAIRKEKYTCFVREDTVLPMMYMEDAIRATLEIMNADPKDIKIRTSYNLAAISFSVKELEQEIRKHMPIEVLYKPDHRQDIADTWPRVIDDSKARDDWGWKHKYDLSTMTKVMLENLGEKL